MAPRYEICVGLEKGHKTTPNTLKAKPSHAKVSLPCSSYFCSYSYFTRVSWPSITSSCVISSVRSPALLPMRGGLRSCSGDLLWLPYISSHAHTYQLRIGKEKRCLKFLKKRIGSHDLAKRWVVGSSWPILTQFRKREEMQSVLQAMRKKAAA